MSPRILPRIIMVSLFFLLFSTEVITHTISSTGTGGNWNNAATWVGGVVPRVNNNCIWWPGWTTFTGSNTKRISSGSCYYGLVKFLTSSFPEDKHAY